MNININNHTFNKSDISQIKAIGYFIAAAQTYHAGVSWLAGLFCFLGGVNLAWGAINAWTEDEKKEQPSKGDS